MTVVQKRQHPLGMTIHTRVYRTSFCATGRADFKPKKLEVFSRAPAPVQGHDQLPRISNGQQNHGVLAEAPFADHAFW